MSNYQNIIFESKNQIAYIRIHRERKLNALNADTLKELKQAIRQVAEASDIQGCIISGSGEKAFVAGADIQEFVGLNRTQAVAMATDVHLQLMDYIEKSKKPFIAAINGFALGGGLELAMACHMRIAVEHAKLGLPETSLGIIPGYGGTQRLTELVGKGRALELILTGEMISAQRGYEIGLINAVTAPEDLISHAESVLKQIFSRSPNAVAAAIQAVNAHALADSQGFQVEIDAFGDCVEGPDFSEGVQAFLEKRKPQF